MAKSIVSLPRLTRTEDLVQWSGDLVNTLQRVFVGGGAGFIDGDAILDGTLQVGKQLATAGSIYNPAGVSYPIGLTVVSMPDVWVDSGNGISQPPQLVCPPDFDAWGIVSFAGHLVPASGQTAIGVSVQIEVNPGTGFYARLIWSGGVPQDPNLAMLLPITKGSIFRVTINNTSSYPIQMNNPIFTLGLIGRTTEPT
jgi:hypothetical protein